MRNWKLLILIIVGLFIAGFAAAGTFTKGTISKNDVNPWDGATATFTRSTSTGYSLTLNKFDWIGVDVFEAYGGGVNRNSTTIADAITGVGANNAELWFSPGTWSITQNHTFAATSLVKMPKGAVFDTDISIRSATYKWTASGGGVNEYYLELAGGGNPGINQPSVVAENDSAMTAGVIGALAAGEWNWGNNDALGYNTIYVRLSDGDDPDNKAADYVEAGYTLTINLFEAGIYQAFNGNGTVSFGAGAVEKVYPEWRGGKGDKTTDDQAALALAVADTPVYGNLFLTGQYRIASQLAIDKAINITGPGIIWLDVGTAIDGIVVGNDAAFTAGIKWNFGGIFGAANSCRNALVLRKVNHSKFDFPVKAGTVAATGRGVWIQWAIINEYKFTITSNIDYGYGESMPVNGVELSDSTGAATVGNGNTFDCIIEGTTGKGLYLLYSDANGIDRIKGMYEGIVGHAIHVKGGTGIIIKDAYLEGTAINRNCLVLENHFYGCIGSGTVSIPAVAGFNDVQLINADYTIIDGLRCNRLSIDAASTYVRIEEMILVGQADTGLYDSSATTRFYRKSDNTGLIANGVATTIFTPSGVGSLWLIMAYLPDGGEDYLANARLMWDGTNARIVSEDGALLTLTLAGNNVQVTQNSGTDLIIHYSIFKALEK